MKVFPCGTQVETKLNKITGIITAVMIKFASASYEVSYFDANNEYRQIWMSAGEFNVKGNDKMLIGFNK